MSNAFDSSTGEGVIRFRGHIAELDALRAIGTAMVFTDHLWPKSLSTVIYSLGQCGWIAMDSFFVLSGFLITGILLDTRERSDYFRNYYIRRSLRIFPLYYLMLVIWIVLTRSGGGAEYKVLVAHWGSPAWFAFYLGNFRVAYLGKTPGVAGLDLLWSLQVEEQFYLLFPFLVLWMRRELLSQLLWILVFLCPLFRVLLFVRNPANVYLQYVLLPCHMEGLALGALLAIRLRSGPWKVHKLALTVFTAVLLLLTCAGSLSSRPMLADWTWTSPFNRLFGYSLSSWGCAGLVLWTIIFRGSGYTRIFRARPVLYIGKISYGIYLLHLLAARTVWWFGTFFASLRQERLLCFVVEAALTVLFASTSWYLFEKPILRLKDHLAPRSERSWAKSETHANA